MAQDSECQSKLLAPLCRVFLARKELPCKSGERLVRTARWFCSLYASSDSTRPIAMFREFAEQGGLMTYGP